MSNFHSHVGIPKCLQLEFANKEQIQVFDVARNKAYSSNCDRAGTENHYYDEDVEDLLSKRVETGLSLLIKELKACANNVEFANCLQSHTAILEDFFKFQLQRSKKMLEGINKNSLSAKVYGPYSHSDLLRTIDSINANILETLGNSLFALRIICDEQQYFVTNSLGFYCVIDNKTIKYFIIPLSNKDAICIQNGFNKEEPCSHYIMDERINNYFNKMCYQFEKQLGNGYIYAKEKAELEDFLHKQGVGINTISGR